SGMPQYIATDAKDFLQKGLAVCADLGALAALRAGLRDKFVLPSSDVMTAIADGVEHSLRMMWERWCDGLPAASFEAAAAPAPAAEPARPPIYVTQPAMPPLQ